MVREANGAERGRRVLVCEEAVGVEKYKRGWRAGVSTWMERRNLNLITVGLSSELKEIGYIETL